MKWTIALIVMMFFAGILATFAGYGWHAVGVQLIVGLANLAGYVEGLRTGEKLWGRK